MSRIFSGGNHITLATATFCLLLFPSCVYIHVESSTSMFWSQNKQTNKQNVDVSLYSSRERIQTLLLTYQTLEECLWFLKLTANIFLEAGSTCCLVSVHCLPTLLVHKITSVTPHSVVLAFSFLSTQVTKSNKCNCRPVPRETCIFHIPWAGTYM